MSRAGRATSIASGLMGASQMFGEPLPALGSPVDPFPLSAPPPLPPTRRHMEGNFFQNPNMFLGYYIENTGYEFQVCAWPQLPSEF